MLKGGYAETATLAKPIVSAYHPANTGDATPPSTPGPPIRGKGQRSEAGKAPAEPTALTGHPANPRPLSTTQKHMSSGTATLDCERGQCTPNI